MFDATGYILRVGEPSEIFSVPAAFGLMMFRPSSKSLDAMYIR